MKLIRLLLFLPLAALGQSSIDLRVTTNGVLASPLSFFDANANSIADAISDLVGFDTSGSYILSGDTWDFTGVANLLIPPLAITMCCSNGFVVTDEDSKLAVIPSEEYWLLYADGIASALPPVGWDGSAVSVGTVTNLTVHGITNLAWPMAHEANGDFDVEGWFTTVASTFQPYAGNAASSGTAQDATPTGDNSTLWQIRSSATTNSGYTFITRVNHAKVIGGEWIGHVVRFDATNQILARFGFGDSSSASESTDGADIRLVDNYVMGVCTAGGSATSTMTSNQITDLSAFYRAIVEVADDKSRVNFYLCDSTGSVLWTDSVTNNIPTDPTSLVMQAFSLNGSQRSLVTIDKASFRQRRLLNR